MKKLLSLLFVLAILTKAVDAQSIQFSATITSMTTFDIYITPTSSFTSLGGISSLTIVVQVPGSVPSGSCAANSSAPTLTVVSDISGLTASGTSTAKAGNAANTAAGTATWNTPYNFSGSNAMAGFNFVGGTAYKVATFTLPVGVDINCVSIVDFPSNKVGTGAPLYGTSINIGATTAVAEDAAALFLNAMASNNSTVPPASNGGSATAASVMPLAYSVITPVTLVSFTGIASGCTANLAWVTATEINSSYYAVEASLNGTDFTQVGKVASKNSLIGASYTYPYALASGTTYFRLKMVDKDGTISYSGVVVVTGTGTCGTSLSAKVSPNPTSNMLYIQGLSANSHISIMTLSGQKLTELTSGGTSQSISLGSYAKGVYMVRIQAADGTTTNVKVVKQ